MTNKKDLPKALYRAIRSNWYNGDSTAFCSVTSLIKPPKEVVLEMRHRDKIEEDASDLIWSLMGSAMHRVIEEGEGKDSITEERLSVDILGKKISGAFDNFEDKIISDYKFTSVWTVIYNDDNFQKWTEQQNCYAYMLRQAGFDVDGVQIVAIFRDWSKTKAERQANYPQSQVMTIPLKLWSEQEQKDFMEHRVSLISKHLNTVDDAIPECSAEERWQDPTKYAVMKKGRKSAVKLFKVEDEAYKMAEEDESKYYVEVRKSIPRKCNDYCNVNKFCSWYKENV